MSDASEPAAATFTLSGLLGDSDRPGRRRLYLNTRLDYYVEFRTADVVSVESVGPDQPPFTGLDSTRVSLVEDAQVDYVRSRSGRARDPFDLQANLPAGLTAGFAETWEAECPGPTWGGCPTDIGCPTAFECPSGFTVCKPRTCREVLTEVATCDTCRTCDAATCATCNQATCRTCNQGTCVTCGQATCATCNQATCVTCGQATCVTCFQATCRTCGPQCETFFRCPTQLQTHCFTCRCF